MADRIKGITVEIGGDTTGLSKALSGVNKEIRNTQSQLKDVNKLLKLDPTNSELITQKQKLLSEAVSETKDKLTQLKSVQDQMNSGLKNGSVTQQQYDAWQREIIATENELKNLEKEAKNTDSAIDATLKATGSKMQEVGGKISGVGESLSKGVTAPIAAVGAASLAAFTEVDNGLDIVEQKTGATGKSLEGMQDSVKHLATTIPTDFETAGSAVGEVNTRFGLTGKALEDLSGKFIKFASLNDTDVSTSVDNVSSVLNAFGQSTDDAGDLLDALNATGQATGISMDTLAGDLSQNAVQFKEMGLNAQQASGFMGMVEMSGLDTSTAMAGLKKAMKNAADDGQTLDQALKGFSTTMSSNKSDTEKLSAAYDLFGSKAGAAIYNAVQTGKLNLDDLSGTLGDFSGSVDNTFEETLDPIDQFQMTLNSLKEVGADIGNSLATVLAPVLQQVSVALQHFAEIWNQIPAPVQNTIVQIALVAAAIGPVLIVVGKLISSVGTILTVLPQLSGAMSVVKTAVTALNGAMAANPIGIVIAAIAALVAAFIYLWNNCESFRNFWIGLWNNIKDGAMAAFTALENFFPAAWSAITGVFTGALNGISSFFSNAWSAMSSTAQAVMNAISSSVTSAWNGISSFFGSLFSGIQGVMGNIVSAIKSGFQNAISYITSLPAQAILWGRDIIDGIVNGIRACIGKVKDAVSDVAGTIKSFLHFSVPDEGPLTDYKTWMPDFINGLAKGIRGGKSEIKNAMGDIADTMDLSVSLPDLKNGQTPIPAGSISSGAVTLNQPILLDGKVITTVVSQIMYQNGQAILRNKGTA